MSLAEGAAAYLLEILVTLDPTVRHRTRKVPEFATFVTPSNNVPGKGNFFSAQLLVHLDVRCLPPPYPS